MALPHVDRLSAEDEHILALEHGAVVGHWCKVVVVEGLLDAARMRRVVGDRIASVPRLRQRLAFLPRGLGRPVWVDDDAFDLSWHVSDVGAEAPLDDTELRRVIASRMQQRLDRARPLWRLEVAPLQNGRTALLWCAHHCMADGFTAMQMAARFIWAAGAAASPEAAAPAGSVPRESHAALLVGAALDRGAAVVREARGLSRDLARVRSWRGGVDQLAAIAASARRELTAAPIASCFDGELGRRRAVAWRLFPLNAVHDAAKRVGAGVTLNDAIVALVGSGVAAWLAQQRLASQPLRVRVPVSLHAPGDAAAAANRDSFIDVEVPLDDTDVIARLRFINRQTQVRKAAHDAENIDHVMRMMAALPFGEHLVAMTDGPQHFSLSISNIVGPRQPVAVDGVPVFALHSIVEVAQHHDLRASVISCAGTLSIALCADADRVDPESIMQGIDRAWAQLSTNAAVAPA